MSTSPLTITSSGSETLFIFAILFKTPLASLDLFLDINQRGDSGTRLYRKREQSPKLFDDKHRHLILPLSIWLWW